jgi:alkanesulfonate monooxygenase SsuD/methylene tetrahydromethanopterin reductase-like flavin-dependent oxidoreductase (luciferase family)
VTDVGLQLPQLGHHTSPDVVRRYAQPRKSSGTGACGGQDHFLYPLEPKRPYRNRPDEPVPEPYQSVLASTELLAFVAACTNRVRLGASVLVAGTHWPVPLAHRLATVDMLSGGRLVAGFGLGWNQEEHEAAGVDIRQSGKRLEDFIPALLACWGDDPVNYDGPFFTIPPSVIRPKPVQRPRPKILARHTVGQRPGEVPPPVRRLEPR